jgi:hypothetical protein
MRSLGDLWYVLRTWNGVEKGTSVVAPVGQEILDVANIGDLLAEKHGMEMYRLYTKMLATCERELRKHGVSDQNLSVLTERNIVAVVKTIAWRQRRQETVELTHPSV